jgi:hypothetical protein
MPSTYVPLPEFLKASGVQALDFLTAYIQGDAPPVATIGGALYIADSDARDWRDRLAACSRLSLAGLPQKRGA